MFALISEVPALQSSSLRCEQARSVLDRASASDPPLNTTEHSVKALKDAQDDELETPGEDDQDQNLTLGVPDDDLPPLAHHISGRQHIGAERCRGSESRLFSI